jgi:hypothetical protein
MQELVKSVDIFGLPVTFKYQGSSTFKSVYGGVITILTTTLILSYISYELKELFELNYNVSSSYYTTHIFTEPSNFTLNQD